MPVISLKNITKAFGGETVLDGVTFQLDDGDRAGLIGPNGSGKTTVLRIINGSAKPDTGSLDTAKNIRIGLLAQEPDFNDDHTVYEAALSAFAGLISIENRLRTLETELATTEAIREHSRLLEKFEHQNGYTYRKRTEKVLEGLSFRRDMFKRPVTALSGGEKSRVALARMLLSAPDVLMLDEATNHLDIEGAQWLEGFLREYPGAVIVTSHDRYFLDRVVERIIELENTRVNCFKGNYSAYCEQKQLIVERRRREHEQQQEYIAKEEDYIRRNIAAQNVAQARGRRKRLERLQRIEEPLGETRDVKLEFQPPVRSGDIVLRVNELAKSYGTLELFRRLSFQMERGDRIGVVGPNGSGKTSLLKVLLSREAPTSGTVEIGHKVHSGYYSQQRNDVTAENNIIEEMRTVRPIAETTPLRGYLGRFLFSGDDVFKRVGDLSGGEQARVALARLILSGANFLVLDEPTNHLDIPSRMALENALLAFDGTILLVTHDRYLLNRVARKVLAIGHGTAKLHNSQFAHCEESIRAQFQPLDQPETKTSAKPKPGRKSKKSRKRRSAGSLEEIQRKVIDKEEEVEHIEWLLRDPKLYRHPERLKLLKQDHIKARRELDKLSAEWEKWVDEQS